MGTSQKAKALVVRGASTLPAQRSLLRAMAPAAMGVMTTAVCGARSGAAPRCRAVRCRVAAPCAVRCGAAPPPLRAAPVAPLRAPRALAPRRAARRCTPPSAVTGSLFKLAAAATADTLLAALATPQGMLAATAVALVGVIAAVAAATAAPADGAAAAAEGAAWGAAAPPPPKPKNAVLVFGAGGRLGREVVLALLADGRDVVAAARDGAKTAATLASALGNADAPLPKSLFVKGPVDVTDPSTLTADLFEGVTQVISATGAVFGKNAAGQMGYIDNMTSERVARNARNACVRTQDLTLHALPRASLIQDSAGNAAIAAAAAQHMARPDPAGTLSAPLIAFDSEEAVAKWRRMDDGKRCAFVFASFAVSACADSAALRAVIMGGNSSSAWSVAAEGGGAAHGVWSGQLVLEGGGFCGCRCDGLDLDLSAYDGLALRVRGDGQRYKLNLKTALNDGRSESTYQAVIDTRTASSSSPDAWTTVRIAWHEFVGVTRQVEDASVPPIDATTIRSLGLVLSRFEFNGLPNYSFRPGAFKLEVAHIAAWAAPRPALVLLSSAGTERNARIGDDAAARKLDIPIIQLNPGGAMNWKYRGESAFRFAAGGLPYAIIRPTGLDAGAETAARLELGQGDVFAGRVSRAEVALVAAAALTSPAAAGRTVELRRSEAAIDSGKTSTKADVQRALLRTVPDDARTSVGLRPLPAPCDPPAAVTPARKEEILARPDVQASVAAGRGARTRTADEAKPETEVTPMDVVNAQRWIDNWRAAGNGAKAAAPAASAAAAAAPAAVDAAPNAAEAGAWIAAWRAKQ
jgi:uncharacterized protein YbjT (DUF2867 family)